MSGSLISADPLNDNASQANTPGDSTLGEKFGADIGNDWNSNLGVDFFHYMQRNAAEEGPAVQPTFPTDPRNAGSDIDTMEQERGPAPVRQIIQPDDANAMAKQQGASVNFDVPISPQSAQTVIDQHLAAQQRAATIENYHGGALSKAGSIATGLLVGLADPLNLAAMAIPVVPEAFVAERLASAAGVFGRTAIRATAGAVNGAAGMAALQPFQYAMSKADYNDYTFSQALGDIAFGAAGGALGHAVLGGIFGHVPEPETRMASLRAAVGQVLDGRPVDVAGIIDNAEAATEADRLTRPTAPVAPEIDPATGLPSAEPDTVRFYHGGGDITPEDTTRFVSQDPAYAQAYADKSPDGKLFYVDIAKDDPRLAKQFEDEGTDQVSPYVNFEANADELKPVAQTAADLRDQAATAADDMAQRARAPAPDPTRPDAEANKATVEKAPQVPAETDKALAEATQTANDLRQQVQTEINAGRMHPETGKGDLAAADVIEGNGKAMQAAASCLLSKGF